jgi:hypothetical protein
MQARGILAADIDNRAFTRNPSSASARRALDRVSVSFDLVLTRRGLMSVASSISTQPASAASPAGVAASSQPIRRSRIWIVYVLLAVIVLPHLAEVALQREHWPFSPYQMWSKPSTGWEVNREMLRGVTDEPQPREIALAPGQLAPIPYQMVVVNMQDAKRAVQKGDTALAKRLIDGLLLHYNNRVDSGKNPGPKLKELRLYQVAWKMDTDASAASKQNPIKTELLYPVMTPEQKAAALPPVATKITAEFGEDNNAD